VVARAIPSRRDITGGIVLSIGKLSAGATEYYVGEVATSAEDYYAGRGEQPGRWVGSLARELGLSGQVDPDDFRNVLRGQHPETGEYLATAQGSASRAEKRREEVAEPEELSELVDSLRAAAHLGVSARYVTGLLAEGDRYRTRIADAGDGEAVADEVVPPGRESGRQRSGRQRRVDREPDRARTVRRVASEGQGTARL
jgi:TrwC relaxase